jgi:small subunit ribosomal protein S15
MSVTESEKAKIIAEYARNEGDTGSPEVQVAILTTRITNLTEHLKIHRKDQATTRGLLALVASRRRHLRFLRRKNFDRYQELVSKLNLRH